MIDCVKNRRQSSFTFIFAFLNDVRVFISLRKYPTQIDTLNLREETLVTPQVHGNELARERLSVNGDMWAPAR